MRRLDTQLRDTRKKLAAAVRASGTTLTGLFGVGPVIAGTIIGDIADVSRFPSRDHFAAYNGTAPAEVSSGNGPGGQPGNDSDSSAAGSHPERQLFGQATPGPGHHDTARHQSSPTLTLEADFKENPDNHLTAATKRTRYVACRHPEMGAVWGAELVITHRLDCAGAASPVKRGIGGPSRLRPGGRLRLAAEMSPARTQRGALAGRRAPSPCQPGSAWNISRSSSRR